MKLVLVCVLITIVMIIAYSLSAQIKDKHEFFVSLKSFLQEFKLNLSFKQDKLNEFLATTKSKKQFKEFLESYKNYLKTGEFDLTAIKLLDEEEKTKLKGIFCEIGKSDQKNEIAKIDGFLAQIEQKVEQMSEDRKKLCPLIIKLSLLFAVAVAIILI